MNQNDAQGLIKIHTFSFPLCHSTMAAQTQVPLIQCDNIFFRFYCKGGSPLISNRLTQLSVGFSLFEWILYLYTFPTSGREQSRCVDLTLLHNHLCIQMLFFLFWFKKTKQKQHHRTSVDVYFLSVRITSKQTVWKTQKIPLPSKTV